MPEAARELFAQFKERGYSRVKQCLDAEEPEGLHLDYKEFREESFRSVFGKCASAFANADGGVVLWGIEAKGHASPKASPMSNLPRALTLLSDATNDILRPNLDGIDHEAIEIPSDGGRGYIVTFVPRSPAKPHMCVAQKKYATYYQRHGSNSDAMDHDDVRAHILSRARPELQLVWTTREAKPTTIERQGALGLDKARGFQASFDIEVLNSGEALAEHVAVAVRRPLPEQAEWRALNGWTTGSIRASFRGTSLVASLHTTESGLIYPGTSKKVAVLDCKCTSLRDAKGVEVQYVTYARDHSAEGELTIPDSTVREMIEHLL